MDAYEFAGIPEKRLLGLATKICPWNGHGKAVPKRRLSRNQWHGPWATIASDLEELRPWQLAFEAHNWK